MTLRRAEEDDLRFVRSAWLTSFASSALAREMTPRSAWDARVAARRPPASDAFFQGQRRLIEWLIMRSNVTVADAGDGLVDGFVVRHWQRPVLHYVYVRLSARERGVARELVADLAQAETRYTHVLPDIDRRRLPAMWTYDPFLLRGDEAA